MKSFSEICQRFPSENRSMDNFQDELLLSVTLSDEHHRQVRRRSTDDELLQLDNVVSYFNWKQENLSFFFFPRKSADWWRKMHNWKFTMNNSNISLFNYKVKVKLSVWKRRWQFLEDRFFFFFFLSKIGDFIELYQRQREELKQRYANKHQTIEQHFKVSFSRVVFFSPELSLIENNWSTTKVHWRKS